METDVRENLLPPAAFCCVELRRRTRSLAVVTVSSLAFSPGAIQPKRAKRLCSANRPRRRHFEFRRESPSPKKRQSELQELLTFDLLFPCRDPRNQAPLRHEPRRLLCESSPSQNPPPAPPSEWLGLTRRCNIDLRPSCGLSGSIYYTTFSSHLFNQI